MRLSRLASPGFSALLALGACGAPASPAANQPHGGPASAAAGAVASAPASAAASDSPAPRPGASTSDSPAGPAPSCMPEGLRKRGKIMAVQRDSEGKISFCLAEPLTPQSRYLCFSLDPQTTAIRPADMKLSSVDLGEISPHEEQISVVEGSSSGVLTICEREDCFSVRLRPPKVDALDEVVGLRRAARIPGTRRIIVPFSNARGERSTTELRVFDMGTKSQVSTTSISSTESPTGLVALGDFALLTVHNSAADLTRTLLVDLKTLAARDLGIVPDVDPNRGRSRLPAGDKEHLMLGDVRGNAVVFLGVNGAFKRRVALPARSDPEAGSALSGTVGSGIWIVLQGSPVVGTVHLVNPKTGRVSTASVPVCKP